MKFLQTVKGLVSILMILLVCSPAFAATQVSSATKPIINLDRASVNNNVLAEGKTTLVQRSNIFNIQTSIAAYSDIQNIYIEATLTDRATGFSVSDSTGYFNVFKYDKKLVGLQLNLLNLQDKNDFKLEIKIKGPNGVLEQKIFYVTFGEITSTSTPQTVDRFDVSIDNVHVNDANVIEGKTNLVDEDASSLGADAFLAVVEMTALTNLNDANIDVSVRGRTSGNVVSNSIPTFDATAGQKLLISFPLRLIDNLRNEVEFDMTVKITDTKARSEQKIYGLKTGEITRTRLTSNGLDINIDRVRVNGNVVAPSRNNLIEESDVFNIFVDFTSLRNADNVHVEAILRDLRSGNTVADATTTFDIVDGQSYSAFLFTSVIDPMDESGSFDLTIKIIDEQGTTVSKNYGIRMDADNINGGDFDVNIDRVRVNSKIMAESSSNFIDEEDFFNVNVDITALEDLEDAHIEVIAKDASGHTVSDATNNFDLAEDQSASHTLHMELIDDMKKSNSFELTVRVVDAEGHRVQKVYGISMDGRTSTSGHGSLDLSIDRVELEDETIIEDQTNLIFIEDIHKLDLKVAITALEDIEKAKVEAVLMYENGEVVSDITSLFNINDDASTTKKLDLPLDVSFENAVFRLKLKVSDAEGDFVEKTYTLRLTQNGFPVVIHSIYIGPTKVNAGKFAVIKVNLHNTKLISLSGLKVKLDIPSLGISESKFVKNAKNTDFTEEFVVQIPKNTVAGQYDLVAEVFSQFGTEKESKQTTIQVIDALVAPINERLVITVPITSQIVTQDKEAIYPLIFKNEGKFANTYTLSVDGKGWANVGLDGLNVFVLRPGETKTVNVLVTSNGEESGKQIFTVLVSSKTKELRQIDLVGELITPPGISIKTIVMYMLITLVIILVLCGAYFGAKRYTEAEIEENKDTLSDPAPYY